MFEVDFRVRAAIFDHTVRGALSPPHTSRAPGFATQDHARARDSNAAQGNTQDMEATLANLLRKECQGCSEARRPSRPAPRIQSSEAIVTSQPWIQLTGGYARWVIRSSRASIVTQPGSAPGTPAANTNPICDGAGDCIWRGGC